MLKVTLLVSKLVFCIKKEGGGGRGGGKGGGGARSLLCNLFWLVIGLSFCHKNNTFAFCMLSGHRC